MTCSPQVWDGVLRRLSDELAPLAFEAWIDPISPEFAGDGLHLLCPSAFHRDRVRERYLEQIVGWVEEAHGSRVHVTLDVRAPESATVEVVADANAAAAAGRELEARSCSAGIAAVPAPRRRAPRRTQQMGTQPIGARPIGAQPIGAQPIGAQQIGAPQPGAARRGAPASGTGQTFDTFVVGPCNALAREACLAMAQGQQLSLSPLYLAAGPGLGKSHLASAVVAEAIGRGERALHVSAEQFTNELLSAIQKRSTAAFKQRYREECDVLVVEDVQFLRGKRATQLEMFHTLEHLARAGRRVVLTAERLPRQIPDLDPRLSSRMSGGLCAEMAPPDTEHRRQILRAKAAAGAVRLPASCLERLVEAVPGSVRDLESVLIQLVASSSLLKKPIDLALTEAALRKVQPEGTTRPLDPERVIAIVSAYFKTTPEALSARSRRREILLPRQLAMYLCSRYTDASMKCIGRAFGRNHPSVANAIQAVERALLERAPARYQVEALIARLDRERSG